MKNTHMIISVILIIAFVVSGGIYFYKRHKEIVMFRNIAENYQKTKDIPLENTALVTKDGVDTFTNNNYGFSVSFPHSLPATVSVSSKIVIDEKTNEYKLSGTSHDLNTDYVDSSKENFDILVQDASAFQPKENWEYKPISKSVETLPNGLTGELVTQADICVDEKPCGLNLIFAADPITNQKVPYQLVFNIRAIPEGEIASQKELFLKIINSIQFIK